MKPAQEYTNRTQNIAENTEMDLHLYMATGLYDGTGTKEWTFN